MDSTRDVLNPVTHRKTNYAYLPEKRAITPGKYVWLLADIIFLLCRNGHEPLSSLPNHENRFYDSPPPQGLSEARRGNEVLVFFVIEPPRGAL